MDQEQINELRKLAENATPGPWKSNQETCSLGEVCSVNQGGQAWFEICSADLFHKSNNYNDAAYIAAANPAAILALIQQRDELLAAWKEYQNADFSVSCQCGVVGKCICAKCTHDHASAAFSKAEAKS